MKKFLFGFNQAGMESCQCKNVKREQRLCCPLAVVDTQGGSLSPPCGATRLKPLPPTFFSKKQLQYEHISVVSSSGVVFRLSMLFLKKFHAEILFSQTLFFCTGRFVKFLYWLQ